MAWTSKNGSQDNKKPGFFSREWVRSVICSFIGAALLFVATETQLLNKAALAKWTALVIGVSLIIYVGLPWVLLGLIFLTLRKMARVEHWIRRHLLWRYPGSHYLRTMFDPSYHSETLFAVTAFVWSKSHPHKLLWVKHRTHNRWLPPGGRLLANELPHESIKAKVCSETGIPMKTLSFCRIFHAIDQEYIAVDENIEPAPIPLRIQKELMEQRGGIPYHYDFFYVLETDYNGIPQGDQNPQWLSIQEVEKSQETERPFPNVRLLAQLVLEKIARRFDSGTKDME